MVFFGGKGEAAVAQGAQWKVIHMTHSEKRANEKKERRQHCAHRLSCLFGYGYRIMERRLCMRNVNGM